MMAWLAYSLTFGWFSVTLTDGSWMLGLRPPQEMISDMCAIDPCAVWQGQSVAQLQVRVPNPGCM
eukprot:6175944-Pyramimonas_sp.AAC.2